MRIERGVVIVDSMIEDCEIDLDQVSQIYQIMVVSDPDNPSPVNGKLLLMVNFDSRLRSMTKEVMSTLSVAGQAIDRNMIWNTDYRREIARRHRPYSLRWIVQPGMDVLMMELASEDAKYHAAFLGLTDEDGLEAFRVAVECSKHMVLVDYRRFVSACQAAGVDKDTPACLSPLLGMLRDDHGSWNHSSPIVPWHCAGDALSIFESTLEYTEHAKREMAMSRLRHAIERVEPEDDDAT